MHNVIKMLTELGPFVYHEEFEKPFVEEVLTFYSIESQQFIECCDCRQKLKAALFRILSQEGTNGLKISEIAKHVQSCDLNDLPSSNALEALVCSSLSSDISLFERISSSAFRLRTNFIHSRDGDRSFSQTSGDMESDTEESDSEESDTGESAESAYEEQVIAHAPETGREGIHTGRPQALPSARECRSQSAERRLNEKIERVSHYLDSSNLLQIYIKAVKILG
jgi:hypothetical protein